MRVDRPMRAVAAAALALSLVGCAAEPLAS